MAGDQNMDAAYSTYNSFIGWFKWGTVVCALLAALVVWLIAG